MTDIILGLSKFNSIELLFFLAFIAFMFFVILPGYNVHVEAKRISRQIYIDREKNMLEVISRNSETISKNTDAIMAIKETMFGSDIQRKQTLERMHGRLDNINKSLESISQDIIIIKERS